MTSLLAKALQAKRPTGGRYLTVPWIAEIDALRRKNFTWAQVHRWLLDNGADINPDCRRFTSAACQAHRNWVEKQRRKGMERKERSR